MKEHKICDNTDNVTVCVELNEREFVNQPVETVNIENINTILSNAGHDTTKLTLYDSLYKQSWQQQMKRDIFVQGLRNGKPHSSIRGEAVQFYKDYLASGQLINKGHTNGQSVDLYSSNVFDAMNVKNPHGLTAAQMHRTRYVQSLKMAVRRSGRSEVCTEEYPQHIHLDNK